MEAHDQDCREEAHDAAECREVLTELATYLDGECPDDLSTRLARHLSACPPCLHRADFERALRALVAAKCTDRAPAGLLARIRARLAVTP